MMIRATTYSLRHSRTGTRGDTVSKDVVLGTFDGKSTGESQDGSLRARVVCFEQDVPSHEKREMISVSRESKNWAARLTLTEVSD